FLYHDQQHDQGSFVTELSRAVNSWDLRVSFLISIREDTLAKLDRFKGLIPSLFDNYLRIEHLGVEAARMAIEGPVEQYNKQLSPGSERIRLEPQLVDEVLRQVRIGEVRRALAGAGTTSTERDIRIEAPYLQLVMSRLWDEEAQTSSRALRLDTLTQLGGAERIVLTHLDNAMSDLSPEEQDAAGKIFRYLVTPSGSKIAHTRGDLAAYTELPETALDPVLDKLSRWQTRILRSVPSATGQLDVGRYEIFHDVLAPAILDWRVRHLQARELERIERIARRRRRWMTHFGIPVILLLIGVTAASLVAARKQSPSGVLTGHIGSVESLAFSPERSRLATGSSDTTVRMWDLSSPAESTVLRGHRDSVFSVAFSPNGRTLASGSRDKTVRVWDLRHPGTDPIGFTGHKDFVFSVAFALDNKTLASGSRDRTVRLWDLGHPSATPTVLSGHEDWVYTVAFSPDGRTLASAGRDRTVRLWDLGHPSATPTVLSGHDYPVLSLAFSRDAKTLISVGSNAAVRVWDLDNSGAAPIVLRGPENSAHAAALSFDGTVIATGNADGTVRFRALPTSADSGSSP
ncbi:MAG TPA: WD40 repeat domain-containing protein, partial [Acidimicrobiales bacterium]|nr:WD40 repeat domain-containing protein [Acidimicrobiales bacterium]